MGKKNRIVTDLPFIDWWTADPHLGHGKLLLKLKRPWPNVEEMNRGIIERWIEAVRPDQWICIVGDIFWGYGDMFEDQHRRWIEGLPGNKILVRGHHDYRLSRATLSGFRVVADKLVITQGGQDLLVQHWRELDWEGKQEGRWLIHGHSHGGDYGPHTLDVGVDGNGHDCRPLAWTRVYSEIREKGEPHWIKHLK